MKKDLLPYSVLVTIIFGVIVCINPAVSQDKGSEIGYEVLNLYLDCSGCYESYIRSEINFVNFVRNPSDADIHLLITDAGTASGGEEYTLKFNGKNRMQPGTDTLLYTSAKSDTDNEERAGLLPVSYTHLTLPTIYSV